MKSKTVRSRPYWMQVGLILVNLYIATVLCGAATEKNENGFESLFNGKDLTGWAGDPRRWSVRDGFIRGQTSEEYPLEGSTYLVWDRDKFKNFVLKFDFRVENGNSGLLYRGDRLDKWRIDGYQVAIDNGDAISGRLWDSYERGLIAQTGEFIRMDKNGKRHIVGKVGFRDDMGKSGYYRPAAWNRCTVVARGNHVAHYVNGFQTIELIDDDPERRSLTGHIAFQLHQGPAMTVDFRNVRVKRLPYHYGQAIHLFDGKTLAGWRSYPARTRWRVQDGNLMVETGVHGYIRTIDTYRDFVLRLQHRSMDADRGRVLARMIGTDRLWPECMQVALDSGRAGSSSARKRSFSQDGTGKIVSDPSEAETGRAVWQEWELGLDGTRAEIRSNGSVRRSWKGCPDREGHVGLTSGGDRMRFRNIVLIPIRQSE